MSVFQFNRYVSSKVHSYDLVVKKYTALVIRYLWTTLLTADLERHMVIFMVHLVIIR